jgi:trehalose-phosphatase
MEIKISPEKTKGKLLVVREKGYLFNHLSEIEGGLKGRPVGLFLDFDGTLAPIVETPDQALLSNETRSRLLSLKEETRLVIISGRSLDNLKKLVRIPDIIYVGNHGAEISDGDAVRITHHSPDQQERLLEFLERLKENMGSIAGILIEEKGITASIHFRNVAEKDMGPTFDLFWKTAEDFKDNFRITMGKKVFEIRPLKAWDKGDAAALVLKGFPPETLAIYIGDDRTDEDAFRIFRGQGISISVGQNPNADYYLKTQKEVNLFLEHLVHILKSDQSVRGF